MPRPSKNIHLLAILRQKLNLQQSELAAKVGVSARTIRKAELGTQKLSYRLAESIGDAFDLDPQSLIRNDLSKGLHTRDGRRWTTKTRLEIQNRLKRWGDLEPYARQSQRGISAALLYQYLQIAALIRDLPEPEYRLMEWGQLFNVAQSALFYSQPAAWENRGEGFSSPLGTLDTILDDIQAIRSDLRLVKRIEKRQAKSLEKSNGQYKLQLSFASYFGWNDRGLIAAKMVNELGSEKVKKMSFAQFRDLVHERCRKHGVPVPEKFDAFKALAAYSDWYRTAMKATPTSRPVKR